MSSRSGKVLILATREYASEDRRRSWFAVLSTLVFFGGTLFAAAGAPWLAVKFAASLVAGLLMVRMFVLYHDHQHHAILDRSKLADLLMQLWGLFMLTPSSIWRHSHNTHHAHNCKLRSSHIGAYPVMTVERYKRISRRERLAYLAIRHPATMLCGYLTVFMGSMCLTPLLNDPKEHRDALYALLLHLAVYALVLLTLGLSAAFFMLILPFTIASALGAYLFYSQHNFPTVTYLDRDGWTYEGAALDSSSFCKMSPLMNYFTANIGYHHIHHLNSKIPFYRLPEAMKGMPELQTPKVTSLKPAEIVRCLQLQLWDVPTQRMVSLSEAARS